VRIEDPERFRSVLGELERRSGSAKEVYAWLGISKGTYSKWKTGRSDAIEFASYVRLLDRLGASVDEFEGQREAVVPFGLQYADENRELLEAERFRRTTGLPREEAGAALDRSRQEEAEADWELLQEAIRCFETEQMTLVRLHNEEWAYRELKAVEGAAAPVLQRAWEEPASREVVERFLEAVGRPPDRLPAFADLRCWLALYRALAPLGQAQATWGVERSWDELEESGELGRYLAAALAAEEILLKPRRNLERWRRGDPPLSTDEWLAERLQVADDGVVPEPSERDALISLFEELEDPE
jgi:transcriptional regulator with XRE-family HTH domain